MAWYGMVWRWYNGSPAMVRTFTVLRRAERGSRQQPEEPARPSAGENTKLDSSESRENPICRLKRGGHLRLMGVAATLKSGLIQSSQ